MEGWKLVVAGGVIALAGMAVGAGLFGAQPATAQTTGAWRDCFVARQESVDTGGSGMPERPDLGHSIIVPSGYVPVGGGGLGWSDNNGTSTVVLCRH